MLWFFFFSRCLILILELLWSRELQKMLKRMKMSQSFASTRGRSSPWPHSIKAWRPHTLLWCSPALEEEQVCHMAVGLADLWLTLPGISQAIVWTSTVLCVLSFYMKNYCGSISQIFLQHAVTQSKSILISKLKFYFSAYRQAKRENGYIVS